MKGRTGILDVYFPRLQMFYSMKSFDVKYNLGLKYMKPVLQNWQGGDIYECQFLLVV